MADRTMDDDVDEVEEAPEQDGAKRAKLKKLLLFVAAPALLVVVLGAGAFIFLGSESTGSDEGQVNEHPATVANQPVFYQLPDMLVNLNSSGRKLNFLKMSVSLELENAADVAALEAVLPRIVDNFQVYLRELRIEDLRGSEGIYRLREELLRRVNMTVQPVRVADILFKEMLVQ